MIDQTRARATADRMIRENGQLSYLKNTSGVRRECWALEVSLNANDRKTLKNPINRIFLITPVGLDVPPDNLDALVWLDAKTATEKTLRQDAPVSSLQPGAIVIYYELQVQG